MKRTLTGSDGEANVILDGWACSRQRRAHDRDTCRGSRPSGLGRAHGRNP